MEAARVKLFYKGSGFRKTKQSSDKKSQTQYCRGVAKKSGPKSGSKPSQNRHHNFSNLLKPVGVNGLLSVIHSV